MNGTCDKLFPRAAYPCNEDGAVGLCDPSDRIFKLFHIFAGTNQHRKIFFVVIQFIRMKSIVDRVLEFICGVWLRDKIESALTHSLNSHRYGPVSGDNDN